MASPWSQGALGNTSVPEVAEGPYFVDELLNCSDIRVDLRDGSTQAGLLMRPSVTVSSLDRRTGQTNRPRHEAGLRRPEG